MRALLLCLPLLLTACAKLGPECQRLLECCEALPDALSQQGCREGLDEHGTEDGAELYCRSAAEALVTVGTCSARSEDSSEDEGKPSGSASCEALRQCCQQISSGPYRADCLVTVGQLEVQVMAATSCRQVVEGYVADGWCTVAKIAGPEANDLTCSDGVDNDGNGNVDCQDWSCSMNPEVTVCPQVVMEPETDDRRCSDGIDNDGNSFTDCEDWSCSRNPSVTVCRTPENDDRACGDGQDNDRDGYVDCDDYDCSRNPSVTVCG